MDLLTLPTATPASAEAPSRPSLRIGRRGESQSRVVPIAEGGKCAIGSSPRCQVLLPANDARPLHCLVSLERGVASATRWAPGVLVNGGEFSKCTLANGDKLSIGPWELELCGLAASS